MMETLPPPLMNAVNPERAKSIAQSIQSETVIKITDTQFDSLVKAVYGVDYYFVPDMECINGYSKIIRSYSNEELENKPHFKSDSEKIANFIKGQGGNGMAYEFLQDLVSNNFLPAGKYIVECEW